MKIQPSTKKLFQIAISSILLIHSEASVSNDMNTTGDDATSSGQTGDSGGDIEVKVSDIPADQSTTQLKFVASGGMGGSGDKDLSDGDGGAGGEITITIDKTTGSNDDPSSVLLQSDGGDSGSSNYSGNVQLDRYNPATGGMGGNITLTLDADRTLYVGKQETILGITAGGSSITMQTNGGDGGNGETLDSSFIESKYPGMGDNGGNGGDATANINGHLSGQHTGHQYNNAIAILTAGGNGGFGGNDTADSFTHPGPAGIAGDGGDINLNIGSKGKVTTDGDDFPAILAQSFGGDGGDAGYTLVQGLIKVYNGDYPGGDGGNGGHITFNNAGQISTNGLTSPAVLLDSAGGNGGHGSGSNIDGTGGKGGNGGDITFTNSGSISTKAKHSFGAVLQSAGGTGGNGGEAVFSGGDGGASGQAGKITVKGGDASASISTEGESAIGLLIQSIGGGNATGAMAVIADTIASSSDAAAAGGSADGWFSSAGGEGGTGGNAGEVDITNNSSVTTTGSKATGIYAQSIGGGGGNGGSTSGTSPLISITSGGDGGAGGAGGDISFTDLISPNGAARYQAPISTTGISSAGVQLLSVGGSGGNGGSVDSSDIGFGFEVNIGKGGAGGDGSYGGAITVDYASKITTESADSPAIFASSIGGGGGIGGSSSGANSDFTADDIPNIGVNVQLGGDGGGGAKGGKVEITNDATVATGGSQSKAIYASSIGGGGGHAGNAMAQTNTYGVGAQVSGTYSLGGSGGDGGTGGDVTVTANKHSFIVTNGFASDGIHAISIGGAGGDAGAGTSDVEAGISVNIEGMDTTIPVNSGESVSLTKSVGGSGGSGNHGGKVTITNNGSIITGGIDSRAILAYSIGGGGGTAAEGNGNSALKINLNRTVGGSGGDGSTGGTVKVTNSKDGSLLTFSDGSHGIHALSVGGGGGLAGSATSDNEFSSLVENAKEKGIELSGLGELGSEAKTAIKGIIQEALKDAAPELGNFLSSSKLLSNDEDAEHPTMSFTSEVGGSGGSGGDGGKVEITNDGSIQTVGDVAHGIFAQSIGAGGGSSGVSGVQGTYMQALHSIDPFDNEVAVGGSNGAQGNGKEVSVTSTGSISTEGNSSIGIAAHSIGGGGGHSVIATSTSLLGLNFGLTLGGTSTSGDSSDGGDVSITLSRAAEITTQGVESHGVVAQSIGGGGGIFIVNPASLTDSANSAEDKEFNQSLEQLLKENNVDIDQLKANYEQAIKDATSNIALQLGSDWSNSGDGGDVIINHDGAITTHGDNAFGILAQSIGGGGGLGSDGVGTNTQQTVSGYFGAGYGNAGYLTINLGNRATIQTSGKGAVGIFAQAIGGGGGYTGAFEGAVDSLREFLAAAPEGGSSGNASTGNLSIVMADENAHSIQITTTGDYAHGIYTQNLANGGGAVGSAGGITIHDFNGHSYRGSNTQGGSTGNTIIDLVGAISATGDHAVGIFAQNGILASEGTVFSDFSDSYGSIELTHKGFITGGSGHDAAGIWLDGGNDSNSIDYSHGTLSAKSGTAITLSNTGLTTINNNRLGVIIGNIRTNDNSSAVTFNNNQYASYQPGDSINLNGGAFNNAGIFDIAGPGVIGKSTLHGSFTQTQTGVWNLDLNGRTSENDMLTVSGGSTSLQQGKIKPNFVKDGLPTDLSTLNGSEFTILESGLLEGINTEGIEVTQSSMVNFSILQDSGFSGNVRLKAQVDPHKALKDLGDSRPNVGASANYLNALINTSGAHSTQASSGETGEHITHLLNINSSGEYQKALQDLSPEVHTATQASAAHSASSFQKSLHSIPVFVGDTAQLSEASGAYARTTYTHLEHSNSQQISGYDQDDTVFHFGGQQELHDRWYLGGGLNFTSRNVTATNVPSSGNGDYYAGGAVVKKILDENWLLSGSMGFTYGEMDYSRVVNSGGTLSTATSTQKNYIYSGRLRGAYNFDMGMWYIRPGSNIDLMHMNIPAYTESGGGALNMHFNESNLTQVGLNPEVEIGGRINIDDSVLRPYGRLGAEWWSNSNHTITSRLASTPAGSPTLTTSYEGDDWVGNVEIGIDLIKADAAEFRLQYNLDFGQNFLANSVSFRAGLLSRN